MRDLARERNPDMPTYARKKIAKKLSTRASFEDGMESLKARIGRSVGVLCLTERNDSVLMWSHYADKHQGLCLQFRGLESLSTPPLEVVYSDNYPEVDLMEYESFVNRTDEESRARQKELVQRMYLTKAKDWSYECERRIVLWAAHRGPTRGFHPFDPNVLTGVIMGCRIADSDRERIEDRIGRSQAQPKLYEAVQSALSFTVDISRVKN